MAMKSITSLYIHWCTAETIKQFVRLPLPQKTHGEFDGRVAKTLLAAVEAHSTFTRLQVWYALLYVVVEGYQELGEKDSEIDELLADAEMVDAMRRFRNAVFHPQENPLSDKLLGFLTRDGSEVWPRKLNAAFERYFNRHLNIRDRAEQMVSAADEQAKT